jgi:thioesterase domain-containing protein
LGSKRLELLKEAVPSLSRVAVLWNAGSDAMTLIFREIQTAAPALGVSVQPVGVQAAKDLDNAFATMTEERADALFMITDVLTRPYTRQVVDFAAQRQLPTMFEGKDPVAAWQRPCTDRQVFRAVVRVPAAVGHQDGLAAVALSAVWGGVEGVFQPTTFVFTQERL